MAGHTHTIYRVSPCVLEEEFLPLPPPIWSYCFHDFNKKKRGSLTKSYHTLNRQIENNDGKVNVLFLKLAKVRQKSESQPTCNTLSDTTLFRPTPNTHGQLSSLLLPWLMGLGTLSSPPDIPPWATYLLAEQRVYLRRVEREGRLVESTCRWRERKKPQYLTQGTFWAYLQWIPCD